MLSELARPIFGLELRKISGFNEVTKNQLEDFLKLRTRLFVETLHWNLNVEDGLEVDEFDNEDALYVMVYCGEKLLIASRGNPVLSGRHQPNSLIEKLAIEFPDLAALKLSQLDWDVTRLCADPNAHGGKILRLLALTIVFTTQLRHAATEGRKRVISLTSPKLAGHFIRLGFPIERASPILNAKDCDSDFAAYITLL